VVQGILFFVVLGFPLIMYLINAALARRDNRGPGGPGGIAAGIPKPKTAKRPKAPRTRDARVRPARTGYCGRGFTHLALAVVGASNSCRFCTYASPQPWPGPAFPGAEAARADDAPETPEAPREHRGDPEIDEEAAVREAQDIIDRANH